MNSLAKVYKRGQMTKSMKPNHLLFLSAALFLLSGVSIAQDDARLAATWQVQKYNINASLPQAESDRDITIKARLDLTNVSPRPATSLTLRISPNAAISSVVVNGTAVDFSRAEQKLGNVSLQTVAVRLPSVPSGGSVNAVVDYKLNIKENTGLNALTPVGAQFLPMSFWYPTPNSWYFARGADYAAGRIQVAAPGRTVIASGTEIDGAFEQKLNVQPFFAAGNWDRVSVSGVEVYMPRGIGEPGKRRAAELAELANDARAFAAELLGNVPESPLRIAAVRRGSGFHSGGTVLVDEGTFHRDKIDVLTAMNIADAAAKLWVGESVLVSGDAYGAIREGLSRFVANEFIERRYGKAIADVERARQRAAYANVSRRDGPLNRVAPLDDYYYAAVAYKGAMIWRLLARKVGQKEFFEAIRSNMRGGSLTLLELRRAFAAQKDFLDQMFDQVTETNLLAGLPQVSGGEAKVALRNSGPFDVTVDVAAWLSNGQVLTAPATIKANSYGEITFKTAERIVRIEIDPEKYYPQTEYSDDVAPRELTDNDLLLAVKRDFDKQDFATAEKTARAVLKVNPRYDDVRVLLARSLLGLGRLTDAEMEFRIVLDERLPTARSIAWASYGIADISARSGRATDALSYSERAILAGGEYGATLAAMNIRSKFRPSRALDDGVAQFFTQFDRAAVSNRKAELDALVMPGEVSRFAAGISGQTVEWKTQVLGIDVINADSVLVETNMSVRLLNREVETGAAVYRLDRIGSGWRLSGVEIFEVR
jgi:tetratricopeptide (TPR) repeat protein